MQTPFNLSGALATTARLAMLAMLPACSSTNDVSKEPGSGDIVTWIGDGTQGHDGDGHPLAESRLNSPMELVFDPDGVPYILDWNNHNVRRVTEDNTLETVIGTDFPGDWPCQVPGNPDNCDVSLDGTVSAADLQLNHPMDMAFADNDTAYIAAWHNHKVERYRPVEGAVEIVAGQQAPGFAGDGDLASASKLNFPDSVLLDDGGNLFISDQRNNRVRRVDAESTITTVVGAATPSDFAGDTGPATACSLALCPYNEVGGADNPPPGGGLAFDKVGNLYIADSFNDCVRRVTPGADGELGVGDPAEEVIETVAGQCGTPGYDGDGGPATRALLRQPHDVEIGPEGALYIADTKNHAVRRVDLETGVIDTIVGNGKPGFAGDGGPANKAQLRQPYGIAFDAEGVLYVIDTANNRIRKVIP